MESTLEIMIVDMHLYIAVIAGADSRIFMGGGGAEKIMCAHAHHAGEARSPKLGGGGGRLSRAI